MGNYSLVCLGRKPQLVVGLLLLLVVAACDDFASPTVRPFSPLPGGTPLAPASPVRPETPRPTRPPTPPAWPVGWDDQFCMAFEEMAIAQELTVDVPRAIEDEAEEDALALARELRGATGTVTGLIEELPEWEPAQPAVEAMDSLADIGARIGRQWIRFLDDGRRAGRNRAQELNEEMRPVVEAANEALSELAANGLACPSGPLLLESP